MNSQTYLAAPAIALLQAVTPVAAWKQMRAGKHGPLMRCGRIDYARQDAVERFAGRQFTPEQITMATAGYPGRIIVVPATQEE